MAVYANLTVDQGTNFTSTIQVEGGNSLPFDLTGYTARGQIRKNYKSTTHVSFSTSINNPTKGEINVSLTAIQTAGMKPGRFVYDIEIVESNTNSITRVVEGQVEVTPRVTQV